MATFATMAPLFLCVWGAQALVAHHPEIAGAYLRLFESFARRIGAAVEPGPVLIDI